jgi:hypothetical protein
MDLAKTGKLKFKGGKLTAKVIILFPPLWLTYHLFVLALKTSPEFLREYGSSNWRGAMLEEFIFYRNFIYKFYAAVALILGVWIVTRKRNQNTKTLGNSFSGAEITILPVLIQGVILASFSFAMAMFFRDLYFTFQ